jgi:hypothetical protein
VTFDDRWVCSRTCVERLALTRLSAYRRSAETGPTRPPVKLGALLRQQGACRPDQIDQALAAQSDSHLRLGEQLRSMGAVEGSTLLRVLAAQAGVSYLASIDGLNVRDAPGRLSLDAIIALGMLPISQPDGERVRVAFPAPVPRPALTAFRQQTGWIPEPFLVGDDDWLTLLENYGAAVKDRDANAPPPALARAADAADAAARVADAVVAARTASMREARWGPYVWVRVQGDSVVRDVLLELAPAGTSHKEGTWQAATTSH